MRALRVVLTSLVAVLAVIAGLIITAVVTISGLLVVFTRRLLGRSAGGRVATSAARPRHDRPAGRTDVIDVTVTEVPADPPTR